MYTHIALWTLKDEAGGKPRAENVRLIKERFEELANMLDGLRRLDVGIGAASGGDAADVALYAEFDSREDYEACGAHPAYRAIVDFIHGVRADGRVIGYER